jgi:hypothetical protein
MWRRVNTRFGFERVPNWQAGEARQLDGRSADAKRVAELELHGRIGRTRPQMYGPRTPEVLREIVEACADPDYGDSK